MLALQTGKLSKFSNSYKCVLLAKLSTTFAKLFLVQKMDGNNDIFSEQSQTTYFAMHCQNFKCFRLVFAKMNTSRT